MRSLQCRDELRAAFFDTKYRYKASALVARRNPTSESVDEVFQRLMELLPALGSWHNWPQHDRHHVEARLQRLLQVIRAVVFAQPAQATSFVRRHGQRWVIRRFRRAGLDLDEDDVLVLSGDQIDLAFRAAKVPLANLIT